MSEDSVFDLFVVGGGINGTGIACDAAGRGLSVMLCEQGDLAGATSSASSKLIHGGLRYLEYGEFRLVREALLEREVLLAKAPHIIWPLRFVLPHISATRPAWLIRTGLFIYDHLGRNQQLPDSEALDLSKHPAGMPLRAETRKGFEYSDCWVDDARLVVLNAISAHENGAQIHTRTRCERARRTDGLWEITLRSLDSDRIQVIRARALVNAAGPWVRDLLGAAIPVPTESRIRLVKGSHIVVPRLYDGPQAYILQNSDRRIVFVIPYEKQFSMIGTTDVVFEGDVASVAISDAEAAYLCDAANRYFRKPISPADIVWSFAGVRPLYDDASDNPSAVTREYVLELDGDDDNAPVLSVFGGKITTYRCLAEQVMEKLRRFLPDIGPPWTWAAALPGGDLPGASFDHLVADLRQAYPGLSTDFLSRLGHRHGTRSFSVLGDAKKPDDLGGDFGAGLCEREIDFLVRNEWATTAEDVLWRRTKCGLHLTAAERALVTDHVSRIKSG